MTPADWEALGRTAVELKWKWNHRHYHLGADGPDLRTPDFRDEITALACIPWVQNVYSGYIVEASWSMSFASLRVMTHTGKILFARTDAPTIAHACIEAVKAALEKREATPKFDIDEGVPNCGWGS